MLIGNGSNEYTKGDNGQMIDISLFDKTNIQYKKEAALLLEDNFPHAYKGCGMEEIEECLEDGKVVLMAVNEGHLIGFIGASSHYDGNVWELHPLVVDKKCQFQGIGTMLINTLEQECANRGGMTIYLGTDDEFEKTTLGGVDLYKDTYLRIESIGNLKKHPFEFYQKCGYKIVGVVPDANGYGKPDIMMAKRIGKISMN